MGGRERRPVGRRLRRGRLREQRVHAGDQQRERARRLARVQRALPRAHRSSVQLRQRAHRSPSGAPTVLLLHTRSVESGESRVVYALSQSIHTDPHFATRLSSSGHHRPRGPLHRHAQRHVCRRAHRRRHIRSPPRAQVRHTNTNEFIRSSLHEYISTRSIVCVRVCIKSNHNHFISYLVVILFSPNTFYPVPA